MRRVQGQRSTISSDLRNDKMKDVHSGCLETSNIPYCPEKIMVAQTEVAAVHGFGTYLEETFQRCMLPVISFFLFRLSISDSFSYKNNQKH